MASSRSGIPRHGMSTEASQSKRQGTYMETDSHDFPSSLSRRARKAVENGRPGVLETPQARTINRPPQTLPRRGPLNTSTTAVSSPAAPATRPQDGFKPRILPRRDQSNVNQESAGMRFHSRNSSMPAGSSASVHPPRPSLDVPRDGFVDRGFSESPAELRVAREVELPTTNAQTVTIYPELDRYRDFKPQAVSTNHTIEVPYPIWTDLPPPTPLFSGASSQQSTFSGSPSTRFSGSPGPGPYSRDTTPTSMSSQSPGLLTPIRTPAPKLRQISATDPRPPVTRRRAGSGTHDAQEGMMEPEGLSMVRESLTSSSSNSTMRDATKEQKGLKRLSPLVPLPPMWKSSQKLTKKNGDTAESTSNHAREPRWWGSTASSSAKVTTVARPPQVHATRGWAATDRCEAPTSDTNAPRPMPPRRPSREGTPDLNSQIGMPLPVVHSNLSSSSLTDRRRSNPNLPSSNLSRSTTPSQADQTQQAPAPRIGREQTPAPHATTTASGPRLAKPETRKVARTPSPSVSSAFKTRFPLFSRRNKSVSEVPVNAAAEKKDRPPRKGPAAGTGHEGYGRLGQPRRRSGSMTGGMRSIPGTMSSQESLASSQPSDPFLAERMNPVVIAGGEIIENRNVSSELNRSESNQGFAMSRPSLGSKNNSELSLSSQDVGNTLWPSALPRGATVTRGQGLRRPSDSSDSDGMTMKPSLAFRRSIHRLKTSDKADMNVPKPIVVRPGVTTPSVNSHDTTLMSDGSQHDLRLRQTAAKADSAHPAPKKLVKRPKSPRKWNLFGRSSPAVSTKKQPEAPQPSAAVKEVQPKPVAFYTMIDSSEQEDDGPVDVKEVLREAQVSRVPSPQPPPARPSPSEGRASPQPPARPILSEERPCPQPPVRPSLSEERPAFSRAQSEESRTKPVGVGRPERERRPSMPSVTPAHKRSDSAQPSRVPPPPTTVKPATGRPSRLPQVGRIPKVNSTRPIPLRPEPLQSKSFSRPFKRASIQNQPLPSSRPSRDEFVAKGPSPPNPPSSEEPSSPEEKTTPAKTDMDPNSAFRLSRDLPSDASRSQNEFLMFPRHKTSNSTSTTSSSCSGLLSYSDATAVVPDMNAPLAEDEIWDEYNDLMGEDALRVPPSAGSSQGKPFHLEMWGRRLPMQNEQQLQSPTVDVHVESDCESESDCETEFEGEAEEAHVEPAPVASSVYSSDMVAKINEALEGAEGPTSSFSTSEFISGYGDDANRVAHLVPQAPQPLAQAQNQRASTSWSMKAGVVRQSHASGSSQGSDDTSAVSQVNLRVGSMSVSKWLTFGHVLFSPVRDELVPIVGSLKRHSILVIDGLGNDDWSFYAAETYPAATFFNLSPRAPLSTDDQDPSDPLSPPNHHQIQYKSPMDKFPFGPQSFTCVVYRFPAAAPESHYRNVVTEARRVLKPGGYMELAVLDMDMNNMGNRARRSVRQLKERIHVRSPHVSLGSGADLMLRLLGRKGFQDIKTCRVGVPVASAISPSPGAGMESSSRSTARAAASRDRERPGAGAARAAAAARGATATTKKRDTRSLADMISDEGPVADENITKMVAKVGRWWYDRCYVGAAPEPGGRSMWADQALLAECEEWRTTLKLMVCHARMPDGRSRLASI